MIPQQLSRGNNSTSIGVAFLFAAVGYLFSSSIWFSLIFGLIAYGGSSLMGYLTLKRVVVLLVASFILTSLVMYKFEQQATFGSWLTVGGGSLFNLGGINIGGGSSLFSGSAPTIALNTASNSNVVASTTTTTLVSDSVNNATSDKAVCGLDCSLFNGDFQYVCNPDSKECRKKVCSQNGDCDSGFQCKFGECSR